MISVALRQHVDRVATGLDSEIAQLSVDDLDPVLAMLQANFCLMMVKLVLDGAGGEIPQLQVIEAVIRGILAAIREKIVSLPRKIDAGVEDSPFLLRKLTVGLRVEIDQLSRAIQSEAPSLSTDEFAELLDLVQGQLCLPAYERMLRAGGQPEPMIVGIVGIIRTLMRELGKRILTVPQILHTQHAPAPTLPASDAHALAHAESVPIEEIARLLNRSVSFIYHHWREMPFMFKEGGRLRGYTYGAQRWREQQRTGGAHGDAEA